MDENKKNKGEINKSKKIKIGISAYNDKLFAKYEVIESL